MIVVRVIDGFFKGCKKFPGKYAAKEKPGSHTDFLI